MMSCGVDVLVSVSEMVIDCQSAGSCLACPFLMTLGWIFGTVYVGLFSVACRVIFRLGEHFWQRIFVLSSVSYGGAEHKIWDALMFLLGNLFMHSGLPSS